MTLLEIKFVEGKFRNHLNKRAVCRCDVCEIEFVISHCVKAALKREHHFCSEECKFASRKKGGLISNKKEQTCLERYGVKNVYQSDYFKKICLEKFGVEYASQSKEVQEKCKQTCLERYGVECISQFPEFKQRKKETCLDRYGVEHSSSSDEIKQKKKQTNFEKFGVENPFQSEELKVKIRKTHLERYGVEHCMQNKEIFDKNQASRWNNTKINHWKTGEELNCIASYEVAFVNWCNTNLIDFDWQIPHKMPDGRTYVVDAYIKDGEFANIWVEIKGWMTPISKQKWEWFHSECPNSELWNLPRLKELEIL